MSDAGYVLVPAEPTARCPFCQAEVRLVVDSYLGQIHGACKHYVGAERIEPAGIPYVRFSE